MAKDRNGSVPKEEAINDEDESLKDRRRKSKRKKDESSDSGDGRRRSSSKKKRRRGSRSYDSSSSSSDSDSESEGSDDEGSESDASGSDSEESEEEEVMRRKRRERRRRREKEHEKERKRRKERERRRKREKEERRRKKKDKKRKKKDAGKKGAVTNSWGKYGIIRETDMWNKRPEFTAWLAEVKLINLETLPNWEEKQMFKEFMEDHNTATFPSKKFYDLDAYHQRKMEKEMRKGLKKATKSERTVFNDEEQRRLELQRERERHKDEQVEALKRSMQSGMAQAMKEQARLREEMAYQYRLGNFEAAAAIQRRLDPDVAM